MKLSRLRFDFILFLILELSAIILSIEADKKKSVFMFNTLSSMTGGVYSFSYSVKNYLSLNQENQTLLSTNKNLLNKLLNCKGANYKLNFDVAYAHVLKNTLNRKNNLLLLSAGADENIKKQSGVISAKGNVVGIVIKVSPHYSAALSIVNHLVELSVRHAPSNTIGTLVWKGNNHRIMYLENIPVYVKVKVGDTIVTSGFSNIFPKGLVVGTIKNVARSRHSNTYTIRVKLAEDLSRLSNVFIIHNKSQKELDSLLIKAKTMIGE